MSARPSDKFIPLYFVLFFIGLALLFLWFVHIARSTHPGLVTEKAYDKGLKYNAVIARAEAQERLGWTSAITAGKRDGRARVTVALKDRDGRPLEGAQVTLWFIRPVQSGLDVKLAMQEGQNGVYAAETQLPAPGLWELRIEAVKGGARHQASKRVEF